MTAAIAPAAIALFAVAVCVWVYVDARRQEELRRPVVARLGGVVIADPVVWLVGCAVLWILFVPLYVTCRRH